MSREGLMDDSGYNFEPSEAEQQAWNEGYLQGKAEAQEECERCVYSGWKEQMEKHDEEIREKAYQLWNKMNEKQCDKCPLMRLV